MELARGRRLRVMGQQASLAEEELETGVKTVILVHGLASCALRSHYSKGAPSAVSCLMRRGGGLPLGQLHLRAVSCILALKRCARVIMSRTSGWSTCPSARWRNGLISPGIRASFGLGCHQVKSLALSWEPTVTRDHVAWLWWMTLEFC